MSDVDWSFVIGCWVGAIAANAAILAYQVWAIRRERRRRERERAKFIARLDTIRDGRRTPGAL